MFDLIIKDGWVLLPHPASPTNLIEEQVDIGVKNGRIEKIGSLKNHQAQQVFSARNLHVLPGLMDCQVHFREPGMEHKEDFETGSKSALLGGLTGVFEMPNTFPPTTTPEALDDKRRRAQNRFHCDYAFFVGASPENKNELNRLEKHPACCGIKIFMGSSTGNLLLKDDSDLETVIKRGERRIAVHCEDEARLIQRKKFIQQAKPASHPIWRDEQTAFLATKKLVTLAQKYNRPVHVLHVTTKEEMEFLSQNKNVASVEVTPQHLTLYAPECYEKLNTFVQMNPPIRHKNHYEALWKGVHNGTVSIIGSDHAPHSIDEKNKTYPESPSGMPGVQTLLPLLLNHVNQNRMDLKMIVKFLALNPHLLFKIKDRGMIKENFRAHFTIIDLKKEQKITKNWLAYKCQWSPFENMNIRGWPVATILHGNVCMQEGEILTPPSGREIEFEKK